MEAAVQAGESDSGVLLTPQQVAARLSVSRITVKRLLRTGQLQGLKIGRVWRVTEADLMAYLQRRRHVQTMSGEDRAWLEAEFTPPLPVYEWGPDGPPTGQSIRSVIEIRQTEVYEQWFDSVRDRQARVRIDARIRRLSLGNTGDVTPVGEGVSELRIDYGPGYRVYFVQRGHALVVLLAGGDKRTQDRDIRTALETARALQETVMAKIQTRPWDAAEHLDTEQDMAAYLEAALEDGDPALVAAALGDIARAKGMTHIARETGLGRESLYKALSPEGNPELATVLKVIQALGLRLHATTAHA